MKIAVYSICLNEEKHVERYIASTKGADLVLVLDGGSTDQSVVKLTLLGADVRQEKVEPFRFDEARNRALALLPEDVDVCVCLDLDEVLTPGWREEIERCWAQGVDRLSCRYAWNHRPDGTPDVTFSVDRIHTRRNYVWRHPAQEHVYWTGEQPERRANADPGRMLLEHWRDPQKPHGHHLALLEWAVREDPASDRNSFYLAREYQTLSRWEDARKEFLRFLALPGAAWIVERAAAMCHVAEAHLKQGQITEAWQWMLRASAESPGERGPWLALAQFYHDRKEWLEGYFAAKQALKLQQRPLHYLTKAEHWGSLPHDLAGSCAQNLGLPKEALKHFVEAAQLCPDGRTFNALREQINRLP